MTRSERGGGGTVGSTSVVLGSIAVVGSMWISLVDISPVVATTSTWGLFDVLTLGSTGFLCANRCLRKVAPIGAVIWTNSRGGKFSNSR